MSEIYYGDSVKATCADGRVRCATPRRYSYNGSIAGDTFFSAPAFVRVNGRTVRGYISGADTLDRDAGITTEYTFRAYTYRKNADAITVA